MAVTFQQILDRSGVTLKTANADPATGRQETGITEEELVAMIEAVDCEVRLCANSAGATAGANGLFSEGYEKVIDEAVKSGVLAKVYLINQHNVEKAELYMETYENEKKALMSFINQADSVRSEKKTIQRTVVVNNFDMKEFGL